MKDEYTILKHKIDGVKYRFHPKEGFKEAKTYLEECEEWDSVVKVHGGAIIKAANEIWESRNDVNSALKMKDEIIKILGYHFILQFKTDKCSDYKMMWKGSVARIEMFNDGVWRYKSKEHLESFSRHTDDIKYAQVWFDWSFYDRLGKWESTVDCQEIWKDGVLSFVAELEYVDVVWRKAKEIIKNQVIHKMTKKDRVRLKYLKTNYLYETQTKRMKDYKAMADEMRKAAKGLKRLMTDVEFQELCERRRMDSK